ncbi:MAG: D-tyrosyl-tRNA(Tyr) deacylase [Prevotellaceae bacterium]|nr:D-tyrosyl-tRNA(Tyr) deacylase [Prevotellaceae bacterium]
MRILIQRVRQASVTVDGECKAQIGAGLLVFVGIEAEDATPDIDYLTSKLIHLRIFDDTQGVMNLSVTDVDGELLIVSQFTLCAVTAKGNRPSYIRAAKPEQSRPLYDMFCLRASEKLGKTVQTGIFGADMDIALINNGPVTLWLDSKSKTC